MRIVLHILIVLEMIAVNLTTVHLCSKRKRSLPCLTAVLAGFTALLVGVMLLALSRFPDYGNGNGLFVLVGFLYLPVLMWLYGDPVCRAPHENVLDLGLYHAAVFPVGPYRPSVSG